MDFSIGSRLTLIKPRFFIKSTQNTQIKYIKYTREIFIERKNEIIFVIISVIIFYVTCFYYI